ncbi:MAG: hypothetical protein ACTSO4_17375 [Promethearchaeota archaeon]
MVSGKEIIIIKKEKKGNKNLGMFLLIILFLLLIAPIAGGYVRYQAGSFFRLIFTKLGTFCFIIGSANLFFCVLWIIIRGKFSIKTLIAGVVLVWVGVFLTGIPFDFFGISIQPPYSPPGYH